MEFDIAWTIGDDEWGYTKKGAQAGPGSAHDDSDHPLIYFFRGTVRFTVDGRLGRPVNISDAELERFSVTARRGYRERLPAEKTLFRTGYDLALLDLATQLVAFQHDYDAGRLEADYWYYQADDALTFRFHVVDGMVDILTNAPPDRGWMLSVSLPAFAAGVNRFLTSFAQAVNERIPELMGWRSLASMREFARLPVPNSES
jgi:hypothetical protein